MRVGPRGARYLVGVALARIRDFDGFQDVIHTQTQILHLVIPRGQAPLALARLELDHTLDLVDGRLCVCVCVCVCVWGGVCGG
jgi:hypothetical protein